MRLIDLIEKIVHENEYDRAMLESEFPYEGSICDRELLI
jgi:hypothetical protein